MWDSSIEDFEVILAARALAQDPTIVILDEANSALDAKTEYDVVNTKHPLITGISRHKNP